MKVKSNLSPYDYTLNEVCRIINPKQAMLYIKHNVYPIDIYTSIDDKTGNDILVMIFNKKETYQLYQDWCNHELK